MSLEVSVAVLALVLALALIVPLAIGLVLVFSRHAPERCRFATQSDATGAFELRVPKEAGREVYLRLDVPGLDDDPDIVVHGVAEGHGAQRRFALRLKRTSALACAASSEKVSTFVATQGTRTSFLLTTLGPGDGVVRGRIEAAPGVTYASAWVYAPPG
ncbi:MAG: hypothetical protein U0183_12030 [Polyangiaceae bacterium]